MLKVGDKVYYIVHAYYHYVGIVTEVLGVRRAAFKDVVQVHYHDKDWTDFFANGFSKETKFDIIGEDIDVGYIKCSRFNHSIPKVKNGR